MIHRSMSAPVEVCCNSAIVSAERDGYFGLRRSLAGVFASCEIKCEYYESDEHDLLDLSSRNFYVWVAFTLTRI